MKQEFLKTKSDITAWLDKYKVEKYTINPDEKYGYVVDVGGRVDLFYKKLNHIPVKFRHVHEGFDCRYNSLTTLEFCPKTVGDYFYVDNNQVVSLEHCPEKVGGDFYCNYNKISSLEFCPQEVKGNFYCLENPALGKYQDINKFAEILKIQKELLNIKKEKSRLDDLIAPVSTQKSESFKI